MQTKPIDRGPLRELVERWLWRVDVLLLLLLLQMVVFSVTAIHTAYSSEPIAYQRF